MPVAEYLRQPDVVARMEERFVLMGAAVDSPS
jgi:hypothetical protein